MSVNSLASKLTAASQARSHHTARCRSPKIMALWQIFLATYYRFGLATLILAPTLNLMLIDVRWLQFLLKRPAHK